MVRVLSEFKDSLIRFATDALGTKTQCEYCGTNDETADIKGVTESTYWMELCECCRESLEVHA